MAWRRLIALQEGVHDTLPTWSSIQARGTRAARLKVDHIEDAIALVGAAGIAAPAVAAHVEQQQPGLRPVHPGPHLPLDPTLHGTHLLPRASAWRRRLPPGFISLLPI